MARDGAGSHNCPCCELANARERPFRSPSSLRGERERVWLPRLRAVRLSEGFHRERPLRRPHLSAGPFAGIPDRAQRSTPGAADGEFPKDITRQSIGVTACLVFRRRQRRRRANALSASRLKRETTPMGHSLRVTTDQLRACAQGRSTAIGIVTDDQALALTARRRIAGRVPVGALIQATSA